MSTQTPTAYIEITIEETATQAHIPATLYYHEEKKVFLKPVDLSRMLEWSNKEYAIMENDIWIERSPLEEKCRATFTTSQLLEKYLQHISSINKEK